MIKISVLNLLHYWHLLLRGLVYHLKFFFLSTYILILVKPCLTEKTRIHPSVVEFLVVLMIRHFDTSRMNKQIYFLSNYNMCLHSMFLYSLGIFIVSLFNITGRKPSHTQTWMQIFIHQHLLKQPSLHFTSNFVDLNNRHRYFQMTLKCILHQVSFCTLGKTSQCWLYFTTNLFVILMLHIYQ